MKMSNISRLQSILDRADIAPHIQREVLNAYVSRKAGEPGAVAADWRELLDRVRHVRRMLLTNSSRWAPAVVPFYKEYIDMLSLVIKGIEQARTKVTEAGEPMTIDQFTAHRAVVNKRRILRGDNPVGIGGRKWQDWVPLHLRRAFSVKVETYYNSKGLAGTRFVPFVTRELKAENNMRMTRIATTIQSLRRTCANCGSTPPMADSALGALYLAAARQAERALLKFRKSNDVLENPCPVNWMHLLEPKMRSHLRDVRKAEKEGQLFDVPIAWGRDFYWAPQAGKAGADPDAILSTSAVRELAQEIDVADMDEYPLIEAPEGEEA